MAGLDVEKLRAAQEELEKRTSSSSKGWLQLGKMEEGSVDIRILDPLPEMDGLYYLEVPVWWVDGTRVVSPQLLGENDVIQEAIDAAKSSRDAGLLKLIEAKGEKGKKIQKIFEYWVPVLQFQWDVNRNEEIINIYDPSGNPDVNLIQKYIVDNRVKILVAKISALKDINKIATSRGGGVMTDPEKGFNVMITKSGKGKDTKYGVVKMDSLPMPVEFYAPPKMTNPMLIAQALMYTDEYMDAVIGKYLYNEPLPELGDEHYRYPEVREQLKSQLAENDTEEQAAPRPRPGRPAPATSQEPAPAATNTRQAPANQSAPAASATPARHQRPAATGGAQAPAPAATRGRRNLLDDMQQ